MERSLLVAAGRVALACALAGVAGCSGTAGHLTSADAPSVRAWRDEPEPDVYRRRVLIHENGPPPFPGTIDPCD